jgi:hypothetical protein
LSWQVSSQMLIVNRITATCLRMKDFEPGRGLRNIGATIDWICSVNCWVGIRVFAEDKS